MRGYRTTRAPFGGAIRTAIAAALSAASTLAIPGAASAAPITVEADLGQSAIPTGSTGKVYLRLSLKGTATPRKERRTPVNVALVIDRSGSMKGPRIAGAKEAARLALERLGADDIVSLVAYNHGVDVLQPAAPLGSDHALAAKIDKLEADGRTALHAGVVSGAEQVKRFLSPTRVNRVILLSDGLANVGPSSPKQLADLGRELGAKGISVTTIGLGLDYNEDLMQRLAAASDGNHAFVEDAEDLAGIFNSEFGDALSITAQDIEIIIECRIGFKPVRVLGREARIEGNQIRLKLNQLQGANERYFVVELDAPETRTPGEAEIAAVKVEYLDLESGRRSSTEAKARGRFTASRQEAEASVNKTVMSQVAAQVATETSEQAVELRDKGDVTGARKLLEGNAAYLKSARERYGIGVGAAPPASVGALNALEEEQRKAASNLDADRWDKTRKSMRAIEHKSKVQQTY
ncbi:MAG: VWA domain-containing protein [Hyphomicrobiaceae bacterium]